MAELPVRIAFCITELDPGGAERALVRIVTGLDRSRWEPHVHCLAHRGPLADELDAADVPVTCLGARSGRDWRVLSRLTRELMTFEPTIVQTFLFHANMAGRLAAWRAGVPLVVCGVRVVEQDAPWRMWLDRWTSWLVNRTVCVSRGVADRYRALGFRDDQLAVVPNGVDVERFATARPADLTQFGIPREARTIISIGRLHPQKGQVRLVVGLAKLQDRLTAAGSVHLLLVGEGSPRVRDAIAFIAQDLKLSDRVHFAGWQPDVAPLLRAADLFVLCSRWEGMPNVLLEAMAAGLPCVATNVEGVPELIINGETGLLVESGGHQALCDAIHRLLNDAALASRLAEAGQRHVRQHFQWENTIRGFESIWNELLSTRRRRLSPER